MLSRHLLFALPCALFLLGPGWAADMPYTGIVNRDGVSARSGPGEAYYATDALRQGDRVEVYRIDEGGWCAIRPPAGSFSLVVEQQLHMTDTPRLAEVANDDVLAYVGSRIRETRDVVQVELNRGEFVEIVGVDEFPDENTGRSRNWYRIAPPAGEFRWIHLEYVDREDEAVSAPVEVADSGANRAAIASKEDATAESRPAESWDAVPSSSRSADATQPDANPTAVAVQAARWKPLPAGTLVKRSARRAPKIAGPRQGIASKNGQTEGSAPTGAKPAGGTAAAAPGLLGHLDTKPVPTPAASATPGQMVPPSAVAMASATEKVEGSQDELAELDVEFSMMVAKPVPQWQLDSLMLRADQIAQQAQTSETRDRARTLLEKMRQFQQLKYPVAPLGAAFPPGAAYGRPATGGRTATPPSGAAHLTQAAARGSANPAATSGFPGFLSALDSLMPSQPAPPTGVPTHLPVSRATGRSSIVAPRPEVTTASIQTPETAPPDPTTTANLSRITDPAAAGWRATGASSTSDPIPPAPVAERSVGMMDQIKNTLLYPLGAGASVAATSRPVHSSYDGHGWLVPIVSRHGRRSTPNEYMPPFALTDQDGNVLQFVTPAPGVNLHRYLRKEIGVIGQQHPLDHLNEPHITASRIVMLDRHRR